MYLLICNIAYLHTKDNRTKPICPLNWEQRKLGENSEILTGGTPKTQNKKFWEPKEIPWMSSGEINKKRLFYTDNMISKLGFKNSSARWVREHSVLIALAGQGKTRGTVAINEISLTTNQSIAAIEPNQTIDSEFLYQNLGNRYEELRLSSSGDGTRGGLNKKIISEINVVTPSINEQIKIGQFFKGIDDTITLHQRKLDSLHKLKTAYLQQLFPQNGELVPRLRFAKYNENWEQRKLGDSLSLLKDGTHGTHQDVADGEIFLLSAKNIKNGEVKITDSDRKISKAEYEKIHQNFELKKGDVLLTIVGSIGETAIINNPENITFQRSVAYLRPKDNLSPYYLYSLITDYKFQRELKTRQVVSAQPGIYLGDLSVIPIKYPIKLEEQQKIGKFFKTLDDTIKLHQHKVDEVIKLKKAYLQKMFI